MRYRPGFDPVLSSLIKDRIGELGLVVESNLQYDCPRFAEIELYWRLSGDNCKIPTADYTKKRTVTLYQSYRPELALHPNFDTRDDCP